MSNVRSAAASSARRRDATGRAHDGKSGLSASPCLSSQSASASISLPEQPRALGATLSKPRRAAFRALSVAACLVVLGFAAYGVSMYNAVHSGRWSLIQVPFKMRLDPNVWMRIPSYSQYDIMRAGWGSSVVGVDDDELVSSQAAPHPSDLQDSYDTVLELHDFDGNSSPPRTSDEQHVLILTPLKNAAHALPSFFKLLESFTHPKSNTSIAFLMGDIQDDTPAILEAWVARTVQRKVYRKITVLNKSFGLVSPSGEVRHKETVQGQRRQIMAKARTLLLTATLDATVDWVLWLDSDLEEAPPTLIKDLMFYGNVGTIPHQRLLRGIETSPADIVTPNIVVKKHKTVETYDMNSWAETVESVQMKETLPDDQILYEGYDLTLRTYRNHLTRAWRRPNISSTWDYLSASYPYNAALEGPTNLYDPTSEAYEGVQMQLDAVGGVCTLVRAYVHRFGGVFPSWIEDHQVETEGFGVLAKQRLGARIVGLPNYLTYHLSPEKRT